MYVWVCACDCRYLQRTSSVEYLELDLQVIVMLRVLGTKLGSLEKHQVLLVADSPPQFLFPPFQFFVVITVEYVCVYICKR